MKRTNGQASKHWELMMGFFSVHFIVLLELIKYFWNTTQINQNCLNVDHLPHSFGVPSIWVSLFFLERKFKFEPTRNFCIRYDCVLYMSKSGTKSDITPKMLKFPTSLRKVWRNLDSLRILSVNYLSTILLKEFKESHLFFLGPSVDSSFVFFSLIPIVTLSSFLHFLVLLLFLFFRNVAFNH